MFLSTQAYDQLTADNKNNSSHLASGRENLVSQTDYKKNLAPA